MSTPSKQLRDLLNVTELETLLPEFTEPKELGKRILPALVIKRAYDCLLPTTLEVRVEYSKLKDMGHFDSFLTRTSGYPYYNISPYTMRTLLEDSFFFGERLGFYIQGFSINVDRVLNQFDIQDMIEDEPENLFKLLKALDTPEWDLSADRISEEEWDVFIGELAQQYGWDVKMKIE